MSRRILVGAAALLAAFSGACWAQDAAETATLTAGMAARAPRRPAAPCKALGHNSISRQPTAVRPPWIRTRVLRHTD